VILAQAMVKHTRALYKMEKPLLETKS